MLFFSHPDFYQLILLLKSFLSAFLVFHSNTIINVFIDFSLRYRLLLYRKPARKRNDDETDFYYRIVSLSCGRWSGKSGPSKMRCTLWRQHFSCLLSTQSNPSRSPHKSRKGASVKGGQSTTVAPFPPRLLIHLIHHSLINFSTSWFSIILRAIFSFQSSETRCGEKYFVAGTQNSCHFSFIASACFFCLKMFFLLSTFLYFFCLNSITFRFLISMQVFFRHLQI